MKYKRRVYRVWSAHQSEDKQFHLLTRYTMDYDEAVNYLNDDDCLNGDICMNGVILESKNRDGIWSLGRDTEYLILRNGEPYWNNATDSYESDYCIERIEELIAEHSDEYPDDEWSYIPYPIRFIAELPAHR